MALEIQNVEDFKKVIKSSIDKTNNFASESIHNSISAFLDRTGLINESLDILKDELQCAVCLELPLEAYLTKCQHIFCFYCLEMCQQKNIRPCPMCRTELSHLSQKPIRKIDEMIDAVMLKHNSQYESWKYESLLERQSKLSTIECQKLYAKAVRYQERLNSSSDIEEFEEANYVVQEVLELLLLLNKGNSEAILEKFLDRKDKLFKYISRNPRLYDSIMQFS